jgi:hypothetical protein
MFKVPPLITPLTAPSPYHSAHSAVPGAADYRAHFIAQFHSSAGDGGGSRVIAQSAVLGAADCSIYYIL